MQWHPSVASATSHQRELFSRLDEYQIQLILQSSSCCCFVFLWSSSLCHGRGGICSSLFLWVAFGCDCECAMFYCFSYSMSVCAFYVFFEILEIVEGIKFLLPLCSSALCNNRMFSRGPDEGNVIRVRSWNMQSNDYGRSLCQLMIWSGLVWSVCRLVVCFDSQVCYIGDNMVMASVLIVSPLY